MFKVWLFLSNCISFHFVQKPPSYLVHLPSTLKLHQVRVAPASWSQKCGTMGFTSPLFNKLFFGLVFWEDATASAKVTFRPSLIWYNFIYPLVSLSLWKVEKNRQADPISVLYLTLHQLLGDCHLRNFQGSPPPEMEMTVCHRAVGMVITSFTPRRN